MAVMMPTKRKLVATETTLGGREKIMRVDRGTTGTTVSAKQNVNDHQRQTKGNTSTDKEATFAKTRLMSEKMDTFNSGEKSDNEKADTGLNGNVDDVPHRFTVQTNGDAAAIRHFKLFYKPFIAYSAVYILLQLILAAIYPRLFVPLLGSIVAHSTIAAFRWYFADSVNQQRVRQLYGRIWVGAVALGAIASSFTCPANVNLNRVGLMMLALMWALTFSYLNVSGMSASCRMTALLVQAGGLYALPIGWTVDEHSFSTTALVGGMLVGEILGRLFFGCAAKTKTAVRQFQVSLGPFVFFFFLFILLEVCIIALKPTLSRPLMVCAATHIVAFGARWYLRTFTDQTAVSRLFAYCWVVVAIGTRIVLAFLQPQEILVSNRLDLVAVYLWAALWFMKLIFLNIISAPWLARWMMLCSLVVLHGNRPLFAPHESLLFIGATLVGEVAGSFWANQETMKWLQLCLKQWSLQFEDEAKERAYTVNQFENSYGIVMTYCKVAFVLTAVCFPITGVDTLWPLAVCLVTMRLRVHTRHCIPREKRASYFGLTLLVIAVVALASNYLVSGFDRQITPLLYSINLCCAAAIHFFTKLTNIPARYRHAVNAVVILNKLASPVYHANVRVAILAVTLVVELVGYTLEHQRRSDHRATDALRRKVHDKEAQIKLILNTTLSAACVADQHMQIQKINPAMASMFGYAEKELVGQRMSILMMPSMVEQHHQFFEEFRRTDVSSAIGYVGREVQGRHKDGHVLHLRLTLNLTADRSLFAASFLNLASERARIELEHKMKLVLNTTQSPMAMTNSEMMLTYVNQAMCSIFGYTRGELLGQNIGIVMGDDSRVEHQAAAEAFRKTDNRDAIVTVAKEIQGKHKNGNTIHLRLSFNVTDDGKLFVASLQDMSAEIAQREIERKLRHYELLRSLYTEMPGAIAYEVCDPGANERIEWVAGATKDLLGYSHADWKSMRPLQTVITEVSRPVAKQAVATMRKGDTVPMVELEATHCDGHVVWLRMDKASRRLPDNNELVVLHDVTAEVCLRQANAIVATFQHLPGFILVTTDMVSHLNIEGDVLGVTGYTPEEFLALDPTRDFLSPTEERAKVASLFGRVVDPDRSFEEVNIAHVHKNGHTIWLRACHGTRAIGAAANGKSKILVVFSDVTATVVAQREAQAMHEALVRRMKFVPAMVYEMVVDETTETRHFAYTSPAVMDIYGLTHTETMNSCKWMDMLHPDDVDIYEESIAKSQATMQTWDLMFRVVVQNKVKYLHGRAAPRREGNTVVWTGVVQDVTVSHNLHEMTKKRDIQKAIAERFKSACSYLSHEIRNQLYPQSVVLEEMKETESQWKEYISMMMSSNATVNAILNRVLDLAKWESGEFHLEKTLFPILRLFQGIASYAAAKGALVDGIDSVEKSWYIRADEHLLKQAATNLVSNAAKFCENRSITVTMTFKQIDETSGVIEISVTDKGRGMTPEQLKKVMVPFGQIRKAGEARSGTGLGLPLTKKMVEAGHKGTLELTSDGLGKGTKSTMRVPVLWTNQQKQPRPDSDSLWWVKFHRDATADILVVDDVRVNRMVTVISAKRLGLSYHEAADGAEAVEHMRTNTYSVVFMDRQMPVMNGEVATQQARANGYTLPIVMTSGDTFDPSEKKELTRRGITAFLNKLAVPGAHHAMKRLVQLKGATVNKTKK